MSTYTLWCLVEGDNEVFAIIAPSTLSIGLLKREMIKESSSLQKFTVSDLRLYKVRDSF